VRLVFVGSPPFAVPVLGRLLASPFRPVLVATPPDRPRGRKRSSVTPNELAVFAREQGIDVAQPSTVRDESFLSALRALEPDVILVAAYGEYLQDEFRAIPTQEILNVHPSLLPRHRGASPIQAALQSGDEVTGVSIQRVVKEMDAGDVLVALETPIDPEENAGDLGARLAELGGEAAVRALERVDAGETEFTVQDRSRVTECRKLSVEGSVIDWSARAHDVANLVRALNPWPLARTTMPSGAELLILRTRVADDAPTTGDARPGQVIGAKKRVFVQAGDVAVELLDVKPAGKKAMPAAAWLPGARLDAGDVLGDAS
jgi:methionyl-tRNA formyltransferase